MIDRRHLTAAAAAVVALGVTACTSDAATSTTTTPSTVTTAASTTAGPTTPTTASTTTAPTSTSSGSTSTTTSAATSTTLIEDEEPATLYRGDLLLATGEARERVPDGGFAVTPLSAVELAAQIGYADGTDNDLSPEEAAAFLQQLIDEGQVTPYRIEDGQDPQLLAEEIEQIGNVQVAPVLLTTVSGHWTFAPGTPADPARGEEGARGLGDATSADLAVAVVDTGAARPGTLPAWLDTRADPVDARLDLESAALDPQVQGHGTFVASLIAQEAPQVHIVEARLSNVQDDSRAFWGELPKTAATGFVSDELQLYVAIARVLSVRDIRYSALNLSLGSYATTADPLRSGFGIRAAIDLWNRSTGDAPILAATGNHEVGHAPSGQPFIPAAYGAKLNVTAIGSVDKNGNESAFSNDSTTWALGEHVLGVRQDGLWWYWGGTSFATAVATAGQVNGTPATPAAPFFPAQIRT